MQKKQNIRLANLFLDLENPRFERQSSQVEALNTMAVELGDKLINLLKDILAHGLNPSDVPIVVPNGDKGYTVLEGNRRIACLKLLRKPGILFDAKLQSKYKKLHDSSKNKAPKSIECLIVDDRKEANLWIERKHEGEQGGVGTVPWDSVQKDRFMAIKNGKGSKTLQLIEFMKEAAGDDEAFKEQIQNVGNTNLDRLLSTEYVRDHLGLVLENGEYYSRYPFDELMKGLRAIVSRMAQKSFKVADIYKKQDRVDFIDAIPADELPDKTKKTTTSWSLKDYDKEEQSANNDSADEDNDNDSQRTNNDGSTGSPQDNENQNNDSKGDNGEQRPTSRETLIPADLTLTIPNERINRLFVEMKSLELNESPNICAVMMRVFMEMSIDFFMETFELRSGKKDAVETFRPLLDKFNDVLEKMNEMGCINKNYAKAVKTAFNDADSVFSFNTFNAYVHNNVFNPIPNSLMLTWDNIEPFIKVLWKSVNEELNKQK